MANCCRDYSRSQALRRAAAEAGSGLPAIEAGMPLPAGTGLTRRSFISRASGLALAVYGATSLGPQAFEDGIAAAAEAGDQRILVSIFLSGGVDSLTVLAPDPASHPRYAVLRPGLGLAPGAGQPFPEDTGLRWHPSAAALATLHAEGKLTVFPAIGYEDPKQSHFTSRHFWEVGELDPFERWGWLGRYLDRHGAPDNPLQGLTIGPNLMPSLAARQVPVATVARPDRYVFGSDGVAGPVPGEMLQAFGELGALATGDPALRYARDQVTAVDTLRRQLEPFQAGYSTPGGVSYPSISFGQQLASLAALIDGGLPLKVVALAGHGAYDTHASQADTLAPNFELAAASLLAFQRDLEARGLQDRVLVHVWTEFGRRPQENGSGTDHGAAGIGFVMGSKASGQMVGSFPGLLASQLDEDDNLRATSDFRGAYCALLEQWLGVDAAEIIPGASSFTRPTLVKL
jgi:uncharacterized protein (DUF1501 family)